MLTSFLTALAVSVQIVAPALPGPTPAYPAESPQLCVMEAPSSPSPLRLSLRDTALMHTFGPVHEAATVQQAASQPSKAGRMVVGALIGFAVGSVLGVTVGQEMCLNKSKLVCVMIGGGLGALMGASAARK